jgi:pimeloyl-ACP methyl ester carboxylesterase
MTDIVLVHGWPLWGATWKGLVEHLGEHRCHLLDLPGAPNSTWDETSDLSAEGAARWVRRWATERGLERYTLVAFDSGAFIARLVAAEDERVSALVLSNTEVEHHRPPWVPLYRTLMGLPGASRVFSSLLGSQRFLRSGAGFGSCYVDLGRIDASFRETFIEPLRTARGFAGSAAFLRAFDYSAVDRLAEVHARIRAPVHLVWGEQDATFPVSLLDGLAQSFPTLASVTRLPGKLLVHDEQPAAYAAVVRRAVG